VLSKTSRLCCVHKPRGQNRRENLPFVEASHVCTPFLFPFQLGWAPEVTSLGGLALFLTWPMSLPGPPRLLLRTQTTPAPGHAVQPAECSARGLRNSWHHPQLRPRSVFLLSPSLFLIIATKVKAAQSSAVVMQQKPPPWLMNFTFSTTAPRDTT